MDNYLIYDALPSHNGDGWMLLTGFYDMDEGETVLVGPCGGTVVEADDMPTFAQQDAMWVRYWRSVVETGDDPLELIIMPYPSTRKVKTKWQVAFIVSIIGIRVVARKNGKGKWIDGKDLPQYVREFFCLREDEKIHRLASFADGTSYATIEEVAESALKTPELVYWGKVPPYTKPYARAWGIFRLKHEVDIPVPKGWIVDKAKEELERSLEQYRERIKHYDEPEELDYEV